MFHGMVEEKVYCRYKGDHNWSHLEGSKLMWASTLNRDIEEKKR